MNDDHNSEIRIYMVDMMMIMLIKQNKNELWNVKFLKTQTHTHAQKMKIENGKINTTFSPFFVEEFSLLSMMMMMNSRFLYSGFEKNHLFRTRFKLLTIKQELMMIDTHTHNLADEMMKMESKSFIHSKVVVVNGCYRNWLCVCVCKREK